mmetsp:Transcript_10359/g.16979  ORF Transcript_10359/g.16979 Transcript_10359/m.16979 type:complete len:100 (+) Transcript_10359:43-342(+)
MGITMVAALIAKKRRARNVLALRREEEEEEDTQVVNHQSRSEGKLGSLETWFQSKMNTPPCNSSRALLHNDSSPASRSKMMRQHRLFQPYMLKKNRRSE